MSISRAETSFESAYENPEVVKLSPVRSIRTEYAKDWSLRRMITDFGAAEASRNPAENNNSLRTRTTKLLPLRPTLLFQMNIQGTLVDRLGPKNIVNRASV